MTLAGKSSSNNKTEINGQIMEVTLGEIGGDISYTFGLKMWMDKYEVSQGGNGRKEKTS